jgi:hypothetical protein
LLLQNWGYEILRALLRELALRFLALFGVEVVRVLTKISVPVFAADQQHNGE